MVERFIIVDEDKDDLYLRTHPEGPLVRYADYDVLQQAHDRLTGAAKEAATALMEIRYQAGLGYISDTKFRVHTLATDALKILTESGIQGDTT